MPEIFLVSTGECSDYTIESIHSTRSLAEEWIVSNTMTEWGYCPYSIQEYELDPAFKKPSKDLELRKSWNLKCREDRDVRDISVVYEQDRVASKNRRGDRFPHDEYGKNVGTIIVSYVSAKHCHKLAVEWKQEILRAKLLELEGRDPPVGQPTGIVFN